MKQEQMLKKEIIKVKRALTYLLDKKRRVETPQEREFLGIAHKMLEDKLNIIEEINKSCFA